LHNGTTWEVGVSRKKVGVVWPRSRSRVQVLVFLYVFACGGLWIALQYSMLVAQAFHQLESYPETNPAP